MTVSKIVQRRSIRPPQNLRVTHDWTLNDRLRPAAPAKRPVLCGMLAYHSTNALRMQGIFAKKYPKKQEAAPFPLRRRAGACYNQAA